MHEYLVINDQYSWWSRLAKYVAEDISIYSFITTDFVIFISSLNSYVTVTDANRRIVTNKYSCFSY